MSDWSLEARAACLAGTVGEGFARKLIIAPNKDEVRFAHSPAPSLYPLSTDILLVERLFSTAA